MKIILREFKGQQGVIRMSFILEVASSIWLVQGKEEFFWFDVYELHDT